MEAPRPVQPQRVVTAYQTFAIMASTIIGVGVLALPRIVVEAAGSGAPLATLAGCLLGLLGLWIYVLLGRRFPALTMYQYAEVTTGRLLGKVMGLIFVAFFVALSALAAREFGEVVISAVLRRTPLEVTIVILVLLTATAVRNNIGTFARIHEFYLPFIIFPALVINLLVLKNARTVFLLPVTGTGPAGLAYGAVLTAVLFQGFAVMGIVHPHLIDRPRGARFAAWGLGLASFIYIFVVTDALAVFGTEEIKGLLWPTLEMAKTTSVPGGIIDRLDAPFVAIWVTSVFTTVLSTYYLAAIGLQQICGLRDHKVFIFPLIPIVYFLALRPANIQVLYRVITYVGLAGLPVTVGWPAALLAIAKLRGLRRGKSP